MQCDVQPQFDFRVYSEQKIMMLLDISPLKKYIIVTLLGIVGHFAGKNGEFGRLKIIYFSPLK